MSKIADYAGSGIPCLVLVDAEDNVVSHSYEGKTFLGPTKVMNDIEEKTAQWPGASIQGHHAGGDPGNGPIFPVQSPAIRGFAANGEITCSSHHPRRLGHQSRRESPG